MQTALARIDYEYYLELVHRGRYRSAQHTRYIAERLTRVERGTLKRLMIFLPPRHSKSMTVSESFPSYFIGRDPDRRVILTSYGDSLARRFGKANRDKLDDFGKRLFNITIDSSNSSVTNWSIEGHRGGMISSGIGSGITGEGADCLIIDDPIKNRQEANSQTFRDRIWNEWQSTLYTRLHPGGSVIIILTRWHEDDLAGRLLNPDYGEVEDWEIIRLPAEAEENDPLGRTPGTPLWPEIGFDAEWMEKTKAMVGSGVWNALYQQRPSPEEGNIVNRNWWQYHKPVHPDDVQMDEIIQSWDCSFKETGNSYVVGQVWGVKGPNKYLLDQFRERTDFPGTLRAIRQMTDKWPQARTKLIEDTANGPAVIATLKREISGIIPVKAAGSKEARLHAVVPEIEAGNVYLPEGAPWVRDFIEEFVSFPNGANDDQVDAATQALARLTEGRRRVKSISKTALGL